MARYISEEAFIAWAKERYCAECDNDNGCRCLTCLIDDAIDLVEDAPTADVVPKSELSIIGVQNMDLENTNVDLQRRLVIAEAVASSAVGKASEMIAEAKSEVAREIFEEIEKLHLHITNEFDLRRYEELKKKYTEDQT